MKSVLPSHVICMGWEFFKIIDNSSITYTSLINKLVAWIDSNISSPGYCQISKKSKNAIIKKISKMFGPCPQIN